jgi:hypothetical protein
MKLEFHIKDSVLFVISDGTRRSLDDSINNTAIISEELKKSGCSKLFLDYRKSHFKLSFNEAFNLLRVYELKFSEFQSKRMAVLLSKEDQELGEYWADLCQQRGYNYAVFTDYDRALSYLEENVEPS